MVYACLTGMIGRYDLGVDLPAPDLHTVIARFEHPDRIVASDSLDVFQATLQVTGIEYPAPGRYVLRLTYNGLAADERTLRIGMRS